MTIFFNLGLALLFFLPVIESFSREWALNLLILGSILTGLSIIKSRINWGLSESLFLLILALFSLSTITSWSISRSFLDLLRYLAYFIIFLAVKNLRDKKERVKYFLAGSIIFNSLILSFISLTYFLPFKIFPIPTAGMNFHFSTFGHNRLAVILIFAIPITLSSIFIFRRNAVRKLMSVLTIFFLVMLLTTNGRGAMLSLALVMSFVYFFFSRKLRIISRRQAWFKLAVVSAAVTILFLTVSFIYSNFLNISVNGEVLWGIYKPAKYEQRLDYITQSIAGFIHSPLFGTGLDTFRYVSKIYQKAPNIWSFYVHNSYIETFQESGVLAGTVFLVFIFALLIKTYKTVKTAVWQSKSVASSKAENSSNLRSIGNGESDIMPDNRRTNYDPVDDGYEQSLILSLGVFTAIIASSVHTLVDYDWHFLSIYLLFFMGLAVNSSNQVKSKLIFAGLLKLIFTITVIAFYLVYAFIPLNSESLLMKAKVMSSENPQKALELFQYIYRTDAYNKNNTIALANYYSDQKDYAHSHYWYQKSMVLAPLESSYLILTDYRLYLDQAQELLSDKKINDAVEVLDRANKIHIYTKNFLPGENYLEKTRIKLKSGNLDEAEEMLGIYIETAGNNLPNADFSQIDWKGITDQYNK